MRLLQPVYAPLFDAALAPAARRRGRSASCPSSSCGVLSPLPRRRVHAQARGGQLLDPRHAAHCRSRWSSRRATSAGCAPSSAAAPRRAVLHRGTAAPRGGDGGLAARPARRRHRRLRLLQHRALRPAQALRRVAARADQGEAHRRARRPSSPTPSPAWFQLLADDLRQRRGGDVAASRARTRVKVIGPDLKVNEAKAEEIVEVMSSVAGVKDLGMFHSLGQPNIKITHRPRRLRPLRAQHRRRRRGGPGGHRRAGGDPGLRGREALRPHRALAPEPYRGSRRRHPPASPCAAPDGSQMPLGQLADDHQGGGPRGHLPRGRRALRAGEVLGARARPGLDHHRGASSGSTAKVKLPYDTHLEWAGEINECGEAMGAPHRSSSRSRCCSSRFLVYSAVKNWARHADRAARHPGGLHRRRARAARSPGSTSRCRRRWASSPSSASPSRTRSWWSPTSSGCALEGAAVEQAGARGRREAAPPGADDDAGGDAASHSRTRTTTLEPNTHPVTRVTRTRPNTVDNLALDTNRVRSLGRLCDPGRGRSAPPESTVPRRSRRRRRCAGR